MEIKRLVLGEISVNCYLILSKKAAIVVDPGYYSSDIVDFLNSNKEKERLILLTHGHFDHIGAAKQISDETGVKIGIGEDEVTHLKNPYLNLSGSFGLPIKPFDADYTYKDGEIIAAGDLEIKVIKTPGHTKGSVCYLIKDTLLSGDMLFLESYGRTDFPGGDFDEIKESFYKLITVLDKDTRVLPGHDGPTTVAHEAEFNPLGYVSAV